MKDRTPMLDEEEIIKRLKKLKDADANYPADALEKRRASYHAAVMGISIAAPAAAGILKGLLVHAGSRTAATVLKVAVVSALVVEAGASYIFRHEIMDWLGLGTPTPVVMVVNAHRPTVTRTPTPTPTSTAITSSPTKKPHPTDQGNHFGQTKTP